MEYTELKAVIEEVVRQRTSSPWLIPLACLAGSAAGAYFTSYFGKKGEAKALQESFTQIRDQLKITTKDTEEIKDILSSKAWRTQKQWSALEQYYRDLLTDLHRLKLALSELAGYYNEPGSEHILDSKQDVRFSTLLNICASTYKELQQRIGPAALYLSKNSLQTLDELERQHYEIANFSDCTAEYVAAAHTLASVAYQVILVEAKGQLQLEQSQG